MKKFVLAVVGLMMALGSFAYEKWTDPKTGIEWTYVVLEDGTVSVGGDSSSRAVPASTRGGLDIPTQIAEKNVTSIGCEAFSGCDGLTSITNPDGVTNIGVGAFSRCTSLTSITIPKGVMCIREGAFGGCSGLTSITIPDGVARICSCTFAGCSGLTSITIPSSVTSIDKEAFYRCSGLTSITISEGVTSIGKRVFADCSGLTSITIPSSVTNIGENAFAGCSGLTSITISEGVTSIGKRVFADCSGLTSITIPSSVTNIGENAFAGCKVLATVSIPSSVTSIDKDVFGGCYIKSLLVSRKTHIEVSAFEGSPVILYHESWFEWHKEPLSILITLAAIVLLIVGINLRRQRKEMLHKAGEAGVSVEEFKRRLKDEEEERERQQRERLEREEKERQLALEREAAEREAARKTKEELVAATKAKIDAVLIESGVKEEVTGDPAANERKAREGSNGSWFGIAFGTWFVITLACMGLAAAIMSGEGKGCTLFGAAVITREGLQTMLWTRAIFEIIWVAIFFGMSCSAFVDNGLKGFKRMFWGMVLGAVLAGTLWMCGASIYDAKESRSSHSSQRYYY